MIKSLLKDCANVFLSETTSISESGHRTHTPTWSEDVPCFIAELSEQNALPNELRHAYNEFYVVILSRKTPSVPLAGEDIQLQLKDGTSLGTLPIESVTFARKRNTVHNYRLLVKKVK